MVVKWDRLIVVALLTTAAAFMYRFIKQQKIFYAAVVGISAIAGVVAGVYNPPAEGETHLGEGSNASQPNENANTRTA